MIEIQSGKVELLIQALFASLLAAVLPLLLPLARNFEYEYTSLNAYLALILLPLLALRKAAEPKTHKHLIIMVLLVLLINLLPGLVAFGLRLCPCAPGEFFTFWALQTLPHILWGLALAQWLKTMQSAGWRNSRIAMIFGVVLLTLLLHLAMTLWFSPQKRATHLLAGFIHGAIYDSWIPLDPGIIWSRSAHGLLALSLLAFTRLLPRSRGRVFAGMFLTGFLYCSFRAYPWPSQSHGLQALIEQMPMSKKGLGFTLHYQDRPTEANYQRRVQELFQSAAFHSQDLMQLLDVKNPEVHIFLYPTRESKKLWFGGDGTDITDVVTPSVHITLEGWPHPTLRHELVHAIASRFAYHGLGFHPNMAFTEGLAVALAPSEDELSLHEGAADILKNQRLVNIENLFSPLFWSESGRRAYTVAGSLIQYILAERGLTQVKALYAGSSWESALGQPRAEVFSAWQEFLKKNYSESGPSLNAEALFRYPGLLQDLCPHSKATLSKSGSTFLLSARQPIPWDAAQDYWPWRVKLEHDPGASIALLRQKFQIDPSLAETEAFAQSIREQVLVPPKIQEDIELFLLHSDILLQRQQFTDAQQELETYLSRLQSLKISDQLLRQLWVRLLLLTDTPKERRTPWLRLLSGLERKLPTELVENPSWVEAYLFLRNANEQELSEKAWTQIQALSVPDGLPQTFALEWWKNLGEKTARRGQRDEALNMFAKALKIAPEGSRASYALLIEELKFLKTQNQ